MKILFQFLVLLMFVVQSSLVFAAQHRIQSQVASLAMQFDSDLDQGGEALERESAQVARQLQKMEGDPAWIQKLESAIQSRGFKQVLAQVQRKLQRTDLNTEQRAQAQAEAELQAREAASEVMTQARSVSGPRALVRALKLNVKEARKNLREHQRQGGQQARFESSSPRDASAQLNRSPAQVRISISLGVFLKAMILAVMALFLVLTVFGVLVAAFYYLLPVLVVGVAIYILI